MESKLKYYLEIADNLQILAKQLRLAQGKFNASFQMLYEPEYIEKLDYLANRIYVQASKIPREGAIEISVWLSHRSANEFYNCLLVEIPEFDEYKNLVRQLFFDTYNYLYLLETRRSSDSFLVELAEETLPFFSRRMLKVQQKILEYQNGSDQEKMEIQKAILILWKYIPDMFQASSADIFMLSRDKGVNISYLKDNWEDNLSSLLKKINVVLPSLEQINLIGKEGQHTQYLERLIRKD